MVMKNHKNISLKSVTAELEQQVQLLESGELLEEALAAFQRGVALIKNA